MKLAKFEQEAGFEFAVWFENGERVTVNLELLIGNFVSAEQLALGEIDADRGCLQFQNGGVDIEPTTLYRYAMASAKARAACASTIAQQEYKPDRLLANRR